jgi:hypothetical protein
MTLHPGPGISLRRRLHRSHGLDQRSANQLEHRLAFTDGLARIYSRQRTGDFFPEFHCSAARLVVIPRFRRRSFGQITSPQPWPKPATVRIALVGTDGLTLALAIPLPAGALVGQRPGTSGRLSGRGEAGFKSGGSEIVAWTSQIDNVPRSDFLCKPPFGSRLLIPQPSAPVPSL